MISRDAWIAAIGDSLKLEDDQDAVTVMELAEMLGVTRNTAQIHAARLVKAGKARETFKKFKRGDGRATTARAYRLND